MIHVRDIKRKIGNGGRLLIGNTLPLEEKGTWR
jgi:hypothetical protein